MAKKKVASADPPEVIELFETIAALYPGAGGFDGQIVRSVAMKYATKKDFFSGAGAAKWGGRWNPVGIEAIYASLDPITAAHEAYQNFASYGFPLTTIEPRVTAGGKIALDKVLDLVDAKVCSKLGFTKKELVEEDWKAIQAGGEESWTQAIGRGARMAGFQALIVPSARHKPGKNIVVFEENLGEGVDIVIFAADQLPE